MQVENISKILALQNSLYDYSEFKEIIDFIVNDTYKIIQYQLSVVVERNPSKPQAINILKISGTIDTKDQEVSKSFKNWLHKILQDILVSVHVDNINNTNKKHSIVIIHPSDLDNGLRNEWAENLGQELVITKLYSNQESQQEIFLVLFNNIIYPEAEIINLNLIIKAYNQSITLSLKDDVRQVRNFTNDVRTKIVLASLGVFALSLFFPITPTVMAPAQIVSERALLINAPVTGLIKNVFIEPNTYVKKDQLLLNYDKLDLTNVLKLKQQEQKSLETELAQAQALGFEDKEQRGKTLKLRQDIQAKKQEILYASQQLEMSDIMAPEAGIILFKSKDDLLGKPVRAGETLMKIADQSQQTLEIWLNINNNINLKKGMGLYYYSNKSPFKGVWAELEHYSYEAYITPQKQIAYRLVARFKDSRFRLNKDLIIGDQGQVKIYGLKKTTLAKYIFQKPLAKLRQWYYGVA